MFNPGFYGIRWMPLFPAFESFALGHLPDESVNAGAIAQNGGISFLVRSGFKVVGLNIIVSGGKAMRLVICNCTKDGSERQGQCQQVFASRREAVAFLVGLDAAIKAKAGQAQQSKANDGARLVAAFAVGFSLCAALFSITAKVSQFSRPAPSAMYGQLQGLSPDVMRGMMDMATGEHGQAPLALAAPAGHSALLAARGEKRRSDIDPAMEASVAPAVPVELPEIPKSAAGAGSGNQFEASPDSSGQKDFAAPLEAHDFQETGTRQDQVDQINMHLNRLRGVEDVIPGGDYTTYRDLKAVLPDLTKKGDAASAGGLTPAK